MNRENIVIAEDSWSLNETKRQRRLDLFDSNKAGIFTDVSSLQTKNEGPEIIYLDRKMERMKGADAGADLVVRPFRRESANLVFDVGLKSKVEDTIFPYKDQVERFGPLSDVQDNNILYFFEEDAAQIVSDMGVDLELMDEEIGGIENVSPTEQQEEFGLEAYRDRKRVQDLRQRLVSLRAQILNKYPQWKDLRGKAFAQKVLNDGEGGDCTKYLTTLAKIEEKRHRIDVFSSRIMAESIPRLHIPTVIDESELLLPEYDLTSDQYIYDRIPILELDARSNSEEDRYVEPEAVVGADEFEVDIDISADDLL